LRWNKLAKLQYIVPPLPEQKRIASYLDKVTGSIDGLREKIAREIERLDDYKKSVITEAVCHGLDKSAKMKDSGIPWVGKVPSGWEVTKGKYILKLLNRSTKEDDGVITCFRDGEVTLRSKRREEGFTISLKECGYQGVEPGDLVVHGMDGFAGSIGISDSRGKASPVLNVMDSSQFKKYIMYYLRSMAYGNVFTGLATGIRVRSCDLRWNKLANLRYILPPLEEQRRIAEYLDGVTAKIDEMIAKRKAELEMLESLKRSIICECVTGKREVPG
jgi:type I restriction enzyme S subunit